MERPTWASVSLPYIRPRKPDEPDPWADEAARHGRKGTQKLRAVEGVSPPSAIVRALGLAEGDSAVVRRRTILLDGAPVELADSYYPATLAAGTPLADAQKIRGGTVTLLSSMGLEPRRVRETVTARSATDEERSLLHLDLGAWVLVLNRISWAENGTPVEVAVMTMIAEGRELQYEMNVD